MKYRSSDIFNSKNIKSSIHNPNSSLSSPFQSRHPKQIQQNDLFRILTLKVDNNVERQRVMLRSSLLIQYIPQFYIISQNPQNLTIKIKQYHLELLPWLIKKDSLFKINLILGIYIAILQLIDKYGLFPIHPNMMRVNQKEEVAVWINKNFQAFQPDQILTKNAFSMKELMRSFLRIFRCCLPNKKMSEMFQQPKQLLNQLVKIKRKQQIHKNCHQFLKHDTKIYSSRKQNKSISMALIQSRKQKPEEQRYSTKIISRFSSSPKKGINRLSSFSPPKNQQSTTSLQKRFSKTNGFKSEKNLNIVPHFFKKKLQNFFIKEKSDSYKDEKKQTCISSTGQLFKRYLMYNTSKFQKMSKTSYHNTEISQKSFGQKGFVFRSQVHRLNDNIFSQPIIEQPNPFKPFQASVSKKVIQSNEKNIFASLKFRKMSSNTNQKKQDLKSQKQKTFITSGNWKGSYKQQDNYVFDCQERSQSPKNQTKQKLKSSFPYKTASTLTSFRLSNQHQHSIIPSKSQQNLNSCLNSVQIPLCVKQKDKKIQQMKIEEQNELQSQFNNIFSMQNSNLKREQEEKRLQKIINEFQQVLF